MEEVRLVVLRLALLLRGCVLWGCVLRGCGDFALNCESVLFEFHFDVFGAESCYCHRDSVVIFVNFLDVVGRIGGGWCFCHFVEELEQSVEADGCSEEWREVESCHGLFSLRKRVG